MEPFESILTYDDTPLWSAPFGLTLLDIVRLTPGINVLDIGSGGGFPMIELAERLGNSSIVYGVDPSADSIEMISAKCRLKGLSNVSLNQCGAEILPFENDFFSLIVSNNGLNNVQDPLKVLQECYRTGKKNCQLVFTINLPHTFIEFYNVFENVLSGYGLQEEITRMHEHIGSKRKPVEWWKELVLQNGFEIKHINADGFKYRYSGGTAFYNHWLIKTYFMDSWKSIVPPARKEEIFKNIESRLNELAAQKGVLDMSVPFLCLDCIKK